MDQPLVGVAPAPQFEAGFKELQQAVKDNEPGCIFYLLFKSRNDPTAYFVMEQYEDADALRQHGQSDAFKATTRSSA